MSLIGVTFGTPDFKWSAEIARHSSLTVGGADQFFVYSPENILPDINAHPDIYKQDSRGFGFYAWKPAVLLKVLREHACEGDTVFYIDAGISVTGSLYPYKQAVQDHDALLFHVGEYKRKDYKQKWYTKHDTFLEMGTDEDAYREAYQVMGGLQFYRKTPQSMLFVEELYRWCHTFSCINDVCRSTNFPDFVDHRHDQSILTMLHVKHTMNKSTDILVSRCTSQFGVRDPDPAGLNLPPITDIHRRRIRKLPTTTVITPTIGTPHLRECLQSVQSQDMPCVTHLIVIDGPEHAEAVDAVIKTFMHRGDICVLQLPFNVGAEGWNGHRAYAACTFLANSDYVCFLDEDNAFEPQHLSSMFRVMLKTEQQWCYSLRKIVGPDGSYICDDDCESLGCICPSVLSPQDWFVDVNCYVIKTSLAVEVAPLWYSKFRDPIKGECDRNIAQYLLRNHGSIHCSKAHSLRYRVGNTFRSVNARFFQEGNIKRGHRFNDLRMNVYLFHFNPNATALLLESNMQKNKCFAFEEWQPTQLQHLAGRVNLINGFECLSYIPQKSVILCNMCHPEELPLEWLRARPDCQRVVYTLESPNYRHQHQWSLSFLEAHFDKWLTYWTPLLSAYPSKALLCLHNTHWLDLQDPIHRQKGLRDNFGDGNVCCVLECRDGMEEYCINGVKLRRLDGLREHYIRDLTIDLYGLGWAGLQLHPDAKIVRSAHKATDIEKAVDIYQRYTFAIVLENCDADGYVSEKCYDCFSAGCIPLYYGNNNSTVGIPEDMYIDLKQFQTSQQVRDYLEHLTAEDIIQKQQTIMQKREAVLGRVSQQAFSSSFFTAVSSTAQ